MAGRFGGARMVREMEKKRKEREMAQNTKNIKGKVS